MSRPNKRREIFAEVHLAERIAAERDARGWTNDGLAKRMTDAGCPMAASAIFKIEKAQPRRRIVVDELIAFAKVFGLSLEDLLLPPEVARSQELKQLLLEYDEAQRALGPVLRASNNASNRVFDFVEAHPEMAETLDRVIMSEIERPNSFAQATGRRAHPTEPKQRMVRVES